MNTTIDIIYLHEYIISVIPLTRHTTILQHVGVACCMKCFCRSFMHTIQRAVNMCVHYFSAYINLCMVYYVISGTPLLFVIIGGAARAKQYGVYKDGKLA